MEVTVTIGDGALRRRLRRLGAGDCAARSTCRSARRSPCARSCFKALTSPNEPANAGTMRAARGARRTRHPVPRRLPGADVHAVDRHRRPRADLQGAGAGMPDRLAGLVGRRRARVHDGRHPPRHGELFAISNNDAVGWGAAADHDGIDADDPHLRERRAQHADGGAGGPDGMFFERLEIRADSGGAGRLRGGVGLRRDILFVGDGELLSVIKKTQVAAVGAGRRPRARPEHVRRLPRHRAGASRQHEAAAGSSGRPASA